MKKVIILSALLSLISNANIVLSNEFEKHVYYLKDSVLVEDDQKVAKIGEVLKGFLNAENFKEIEAYMEPKSFEDFKMIPARGEMTDDEFFERRKPVEEVTVLLLIDEGGRYRTIVRTKVGLRHSYESFGFDKETLLVRSGTLNANEDPIYKAISFLNYDKSLKFEISRH